MDICRGLVLFWDNTTKIGHLIAFKQISDDQEIEDMKQVGVCCFQWNDLDEIYKFRGVIEGDRVKLNLRSHPDMENRARSSDDLIGVIVLAFSLSNVSITNNN